MTNRMERSKSAAAFRGGCNGSPHAGQLAACVLTGCEQMGHFTKPAGRAAESPGLTGAIKASTSKPQSSQKSLPSLRAMFAELQKGQFMNVFFVLCRNGHLSGVMIVFQGRNPNTK